jgi:hypothetical protein
MKTWMKKVVNDSPEFVDLPQEVLVGTLEFPKFAFP